MDFKDDPIADEVQKIMIPLKQKAELTGGAQYNRVFEAFYKLITEKNKEIESLKKT